MTIGITRTQRVFSRILFYLGVAVTIWVMGAVSPQSGGGWLTDEELGVAKVYIASPVVPESAESKASN